MPIGPVTPISKCECCWSIIVLHDSIPRRSITGPYIVVVRSQTRSRWTVSTFGASFLAARADSTASLLRTS